MLKKTLLIFLILNFCGTVVKADILQNSAVWKFFSKITTDAITNFPEVPIMKKNIEKGILKFGSSTYVGDIKRNKAHGNGVFKFSNGSTYEGKFKRNMFHGNGIYIDENGNSFTGKWKYNKLNKSINHKTREVIKLSKSLGKSNYFEIRGEGDLYNKWFEAEISHKNSEEIILATELTIFELPSVFSKHYGDEDKIKELLDEKNAKIISQNIISSKNKSNMPKAFVLTDKGKKDMNEQKKMVSAGAVPSGSGHMMMGAGGC